MFKVRLISSVLFLAQMATMQEYIKQLEAERKCILEIFDLHCIIPTISDHHSIRSH